MVIEIDLKDKKLLYELDNNSRQSCSRIGKKIGLSSEVVNYRIKRLEKENIITQYQLIVNLSKLNIIQFKICLSFQHLKSNELDKIIQELKKIDSTKWIISCKGNWDLIISMETDSIDNIDELKNNILTKFENYINKKAISILIEAQTYNRDYLLEDKSLITNSRIIMKKDKIIKIDELDIKILKKLAENARKPIINIASELKQSVRIINYRIKQLEKSKIILGYKIAINYEKLGIIFFKTFVYLDNPNEERIKSLIRYLGQNKNIIHHVKVLGNWDLEPEFEVQSESEFNKILQEMKDQYSDIIKDIEIITILKEHKFVYF
ncbi:MAG: Lrp/AsnC family transcriptional regulator [Candidatus Nanoarchaeia archaeon]|nr:Lrp/AsnC family transcriptional regulator [Candidatus Nanoarchaeia archaeon]